MALWRGSFEYGFENCWDGLWVMEGKGFAFGGGCSGICCWWNEYFVLPTMVNAFIIARKIIHVESECSVA